MRNDESQALPGNMSLQAVLKKSGEMIATHDVPIYSSDMKTLHEAMIILQQEVNNTLTCLIGTETNGNGVKNSESEDDLDDESDADEAAVNGTKRKAPDPKNNKKLKTS